MTVGAFAVDDGVPRGHRCRGDDDERQSRCCRVRHVERIEEARSREEEKESRCVMDGMSENVRWGGVWEGRNVGGRIPKATRTTCAKRNAKGSRASRKAQKTIVTPHQASLSLRCAPWLRLPCCASSATAVTSRAISESQAGWTRRAAPGTIAPRVTGGTLVGGGGAKGEADAGDVSGTAEGEEERRGLCSIAEPKASRTK